MTKHNLPHRSIDIPAVNSKAFWFGEPTSDNVVLYFHGGGYAMPGGDGHFEFVTSLLSKAKSQNKSLAVLVLQYDLAPEGKYPRQLEQAVELLRHTIFKLGKTPSQITLMGDSAGAQAALGILSHILHPHPEIEQLELSEPLAGAVICSPVTIFNCDHERFRTHEAQDPAPTVTLKKWMENYLGGRGLDAWNSPLLNDSKWWAGLDDILKGMLITVAANEMFAPQTRETAAKIKVSPIFDHFCFRSQANSI